MYSLTRFDCTFLDSCILCVLNVLFGMHSTLLEHLTFVSRVLLFIHDYMVFLFVVAGPICFCLTRDLLTSDL